MTATPAFRSEADLCAKFIASIDRVRWTAYAETAGWDILLVRRPDGFQIGIQAKMAFNAEVICQALDQYGHWSVDKPGPDCRAILAPSKNAQRNLHRICTYIGVTPILMESPLRESWNRSDKFRPRLPVDGQEWITNEWFEQAPTKRCTLPEYVPDVAAGASAPLQLTEWKIKAIKLAIIIETRGFATRADFNYLQLDHRRWIAPDQQWLVVKDGVFKAGLRMPRFRKAHPKNYKEIKDDAARWMPKLASTPAKQEVLPI